MTAPRPAARFLGLLALAYALLLLALLHARLRGAEGEPGRAAGAALVRSAGLTDLCLFTEARYTRHLSQADAFTPRQDHPGALEHFPSGTLVSPPARP